MANDLTLADAVLSANTGLDAIKRAPIVEENTGIKCLRIQDVNQEKDFLNWGYTLVEKRNFEKFQLKESDILIARTGGSVGSNRYIYQELQAVYNNGLIRIRVNTEKHNPKFIYYLLQTKQFESHINSIAYSTSAQPNMKIRDFLRFEFKELGLDIENAVEEILSNLDAKIELNRQTNQTLEQMAQALFKSWFVDFDPVIDNALAAGNPIPDELQARVELRQRVIAERTTNPKLKPLPDDIQQLFPSEFEESELGWIPKGWLVCSLGEKVTVKRGGSPRPIQDFLSARGLPWTKISDATASNTRFIKKTKEFIKPEGLSKTTLLKKGTLILSNSATPGLPKFLDLDACIHDGWLHFPDKHIFTDLYLYQLFLVVRKELVQQGNGSVFTNLKTDILKNHRVVVPSKYVLSKFDNLLTDIHKKIHGISESTTTLERLRDTLLPKLISGEITINKDVK
jgi:type I restriction enzyme S subunit